MVACRRVSKCPKAGKRRAVAALARDGGRVLAHREKHPFPRVTQLSNLDLAFLGAAQGKHGQPEVQAFEHRLETRLWEIRRHVRDLGKRLLRRGLASRADHDAAGTASRTKARRPRARRRLQGYSVPGILRGMAARKFAISVPEDVMRQVDRAAARRGTTRSRFIADVLARVARARTDAEISRRVDALFSDPEVVREQADTARAFHRAAPRGGAEW